MRMRSSRAWLIAAGLLLVSGAVLVTTSDGTSVGWFAYAPQGDSIGPDSFFLLTASQALGWAAWWVASLIVTGVVAHWLLVRRLAREGDQAD